MITDEDLLGMGLGVLDTKTGFLIPISGWQYDLHKISFRERVLLTLGFSLYKDSDVFWCGRALILSDDPFNDLWEYHQFPITMKNGKYPNYIKEEFHVHEDTEQT